jgi:hypothetical protein
MKLLLDKLQHHFVVLENHFTNYANKWEKHFVAFKSRAINRVTKLEQAVAQFNTWRLEMEGSL